MKQGVQFPGHKMVVAAIEIHPAMVHENETNCCIQCQQCEEKNPPKRRRRKVTGEPPQDPVPPPPETPPTHSVDHPRTQSSDLDVVPPVQVYIHT